MGTENEAMIEETENYNILPPYKTKIEEAKYRISQAEENLETQEKNYMSVVKVIHDTNTQLNSIKNRIIDNVLPKIKTLFNDLNSDIDISKAKIMNEIEEIDEALKISEKPEKPSVSSGILSGFFLGLILSLAASGGLVLFVAHKLGLVVPQDKLISVEDSNKILEYIGLGFTGEAGNVLIGWGIIGAVMLMSLLIIFSFVSWRAKSNSFQRAKKYEKEVSKTIEEMKNKEQELKELFSILKTEKRIFEIYEVLLLEYVAKAKRISVVEKISSISDKNQELKKIMKNISDLTIRLIDLINEKIIKNNDINKDIESTINSSKTLINDRLSIIYSTQKDFI